MAPTVVFADIVDVVENYVQAQLTARGQAAPVGVKVPTPRPTRFVIIRELGGARPNLVMRQAQLGLEAWESTEVKAKDLGNLVYSLIHSMASTTQDGVVIYGTNDLAGLASNPDPISLSPRYSATITMNYRGTPG